MANRPTISDLDVRDPARLRSKLDLAYAEIANLRASVDQLSAKITASQGQGAGISQQDRDLLLALSIGSRENPLPSQKALIPTVDALPSTSVSQDGDTVRLSTDGIIYTFVGALQIWAAISAAVPPNMMTTSTNQTVDIGVVKTWRATQKIETPLAAELSLEITNTDASAASRAQLRLTSDAGDLLQMSQHALARVITRYGITLGGWGELSAFTGVLGLLLGTQDAVPIAMGTANVERLRIDGTGNIKYSLPFGAYWQLTIQTAQVTLSTIGATTDSAANLLTGNGLIGPVLVRVTTAITGPTTSVDVGDSTTAARFGNIGTLTAGVSVNMLNHWKGGVATDATGPVEFVARKVRFTANGGTPTGGVVRIVTVCLDSIPPTS